MFISEVYITTLQTGGFADSEKPLNASQTPTVCPRHEYILGSWQHLQMVRMKASTTLDKYLMYVWRNFKHMVGKNTFLYSEIVNVGEGASK